MDSPARPAVYRIGAFVLDSGNEALRAADGAEIPLRAQSFALLRLMVENAGQLVTRQTIMQTLWPNIYVGDDSITQCVHDIRRVLGHGSNRPLRTVRGRGYIFDADAVRREPPRGKAVVDYHDFRSDETTLSIDARDAAVRGAGSVFGGRPDSERPVWLSVLILPLRNLDATDANERLAEQITGDIVTDLTRYLANLAPREARVLFHDDRLPHWRTAPRDCQVDYVLRGSLRGEGRTTMNLQLMDAASGVCIWAERCDPHGQRDLIARLVHGISTVLVRETGHRIDALSQSKLTARELFMRGRAWLLGPVSAANRREARHCFERALAMHPESAGSRLGVATVLISNVADHWSQTAEQDMARAEALLADVPRADTNLASNHFLHGILRRVQGRLDESRAELECALELAPPHAMAANQLGLTLTFLGQPEAGLPHLERSIRVAPHGVEAPFLLNNLGMCRLLLGDTGVAADRLRMGAAGNPHYFGTPLLLSAALALGGPSSEASANLRRAAELCPALATLSSLREAMRRWTAPDFMSVYEHTIERGLRRAGMPEA